MSDRVLKTLQNCCMSPKLKPTSELSPNTFKKHNKENKRKEGLLECPYCKVYILRSCYSKHTKKQHRLINIKKIVQKTLTCNWCKSFNTTNKRLMKEHFRKVHPDKNELNRDDYFTNCKPLFSCKYPNCPFKGFTNTVITWHEYSVHEKNNFNKWKKKFLNTVCLFCKGNIPNENYLMHQSKCHITCQ